MKPPEHIHLTFPLNVYAHSLYLQQGQVNYLHYGLVEENEDVWELGALAAQQRSTDLLLARLPPPPCRILEVGIGLGTLAALLMERGYQVTGICPDPYQIAIARQRIHSGFRLQCLTFEEFNTLEQSYEVILLQESAQYLKPLTLFNKAHHLLSEKGQLLIIDEIGLRRCPQDGLEGLPLLKYSLAQAERCGFKLLEQLDLSKKAAPTLDYLLSIIQIYQQQLLSDLNLSAKRLADLVDSLRLYQDKYRDGRYGYVLLRFEKTKTPYWRVVEITSNDQEAVRTLFERVFKNQMSKALWEWKYGHGRGMAMAAWKKGRIVAHYGGVLRELCYFGVPKTGVQIADVMVDEKERGILTRQGPYFLAGATFPEYYAGYGNRILLGFGFPTGRAIRVAELLGLYAQVGKMTEIRWSTHHGLPHLWTRIRHLHPLEHAADREVVNHLWNQMQGGFKEAIIGVRDWDYVQHRYISHPLKHYDILVVSNRFGGEPLGMVVLSREAEICKLLDIIAPLKHLNTLIKQTQRIVGRWGIPTLSLWITENFVNLFTQTGGESYPLDVRIPHCIWYDGPPVSEVQGKWWLMGGDTDFM
jgi:SAM-dependent methyltransferase